MTTPNYADHISQIVEGHRYSNGPGGEELTEVWKAYGLQGLANGSEQPNRTGIIGGNPLYTSATGGNAAGGYPFEGAPVDPAPGTANGPFDVSTADVADPLTQASDKWAFWRGMRHWTYPDLYLDEYTVIPIGNSVTEATIVGKFRTIGLPEASTPGYNADNTFGGRRWLMGFKTSSTVLADKTSYGYTGTGDNQKLGLVVIGYNCAAYGTINTPGAPFNDYPQPNQAANPLSQLYKYEYGEMDGLESLVTWEWTYNQISYANPASGSNGILQTVAGIVNAYNGVISSTSMFPLTVPLNVGSGPYGCDPFTIRTRVIASNVTPRRNMMIPDPTSGKLMYLQQVKYVLEYRQRGWRECLTFRFPDSGMIPADIAQPGVHIADAVNHPAVYSAPNSGGTPPKQNTDPLSGNGWVLGQAVLAKDLTALCLVDPGAF